MAKLPAEAKRDLEAAISAAGGSDDPGVYLGAFKDLGTKLFDAEAEKREAIAQKLDGLERKLIDEVIPTVIENIFRDMGSVAEIGSDDRKPLSIKHELKTGVLGQVELCRNVGGYVPALTKWAGERVGAMVLALADAYVEVFTLFGVASDRQTETSLQTTARQMAAGSISAVRVELDLMAKRTKRHPGDPGGHLEREIGAAMNTALKEGVLRLKRQRIQIRHSVGLLPQMDGCSSTTSHSKADLSGVAGGSQVEPQEAGERPEMLERHDLLERVSPNDPNYEVAKLFYLKGWSGSNGLVADAYAGRGTLSGWVEECVNAFDQAAQAQVDIRDAIPIPAACRELDEMVEKSIPLIRGALAPESKRLGEAETADALAEFDRRVREIAARSKKRILDRELAAVTQPNPLTGNAAGTKPTSDGDVSTQARPVQGAPVHQGDRRAKRPARRNARYAKIDAALRAISASQPRSQTEILQSLEERRVVTPPAEPFLSANGWLAGFRRDQAAARAWLSKRWAKSQLPPLPRGPKTTE